MNHCLLLKIFQPRKKVPNSLVMSIITLNIPGHCKLPDKDKYMFVLSVDRFREFNQRSSKRRPCYKALFTIMRSLTSKAIRNSIEFTGEAFQMVMRKLSVV